MTIENHVVSLDIAKRLKELGITQDSLFYYGAFENPMYGIINEESCPEDRYGLFYKEEKIFGNCDYSISAYLATELLQWIPNEISYDDKCHILYVENQGTQWAVYYRQFLNDQFVPYCRTGENIQNTLGEMLIHLIENKIIKVEDLK